ncbi:hypothetical protein yc1106_09220 [Curvularia clavata]|uniref:Uncharacterized protein n=1 Tax=Curvularia clavata TaxID=95742 RepID=A0A9Q8ZH36_CURCL|nr:hypothetical protein yc1106_09220 [Curvularia clavata]
MKAFTLLVLIASALAAPANKGGCGNAAGAAAGGAAACTKTRADLEKGIQDNLNIQAQELAGVQTLQKQIGTADFKTTQAKVLKIQQQGIDIRVNNQKLAKQINSTASAGLDIVQGAQLKEMSQVQGLTGTAATEKADKETLATLVQEVQDGTKQNQKNLADAKSSKC